MVIIRRAVGRSQIATRYNRSYVNLLDTELIDVNAN
jgi:hypothetical protein